MRTARSAQSSAPAGMLYLLERELEITRAGKTQKEKRPLYPGYVFWGTENLQDDDPWRWRQIPGFLRLLETDGKPATLKTKDLDLLRHFLSFGDTLGISRVSFDATDRIVVAQGPLMGLEGRIIKVDKRKRRAKVRLEIYDSPIDIDFGFEILNPLEKEA